MTLMRRDGVTCAMPMLGSPTVSLGYPDDTLGCFSVSLGLDARVQHSRIPGPSRMLSG